MSQYVLAHDLGTSGNKATLFDTDGRLIKSTVYSYGLMTGENGEAEQNADDWWKAVCETSRRLTAEIRREDVIAVSFSGQMMGCLCVDREGMPLHNALIWADMRSTRQAALLRERISAERYYAVTGHRISASDSITKLMWIRDNLPEVYEKTYKMLNAKDYIIYRLTGQFVTEPSDASSTCLLDLNTLDWSEEILSVSGLDKEKLPQLLSSVAVAGGITKEAAALTGLCEGTPVVCGGGDGCCAAVGTGIVKEGVANCCLGTSSWISFASKTPVCDKDMSVFNFAHIVPGYIMPCGTMQTGGGSLSWAVDTLYGTPAGNEAPSKDAIYRSVAEEVAASPMGAKGLFFLPYLMGERSPRWNDKAKGAFLGLTMGHSRGDMLRAVMEGVGLNLDIILKIFRDSGADISRLILIGGGARNRIWQKILCDVFGIPVLVPNYLEEATSMGAAITAGVGVGAFADFGVIDKFIRIQEENAPDPASHDYYRSRKALFDKAYFATEELFKTI